MAELKGSKTEQCLKEAFAGESQAHGGWPAVVWVSPKIAALMAGRLPAVG